MIKFTSDWQLRCPKCGRTRLLSEVGGFRLAASVGKRVFGWCSQCGWFRWAILEVVPKVEAGQPTVE
jgi:hypothetical protein